MLLDKRWIGISLCVLACGTLWGAGDELEKEETYIWNSVACKYGAQSEQYKKACFQLAEKYRAAANDAVKDRQKAGYYCKAYEYFRDAGDRAKMADTAAAGAECSEDMRLLHYFDLFRAGRKDELYRHAKACFQKNPSDVSAPYWLGAMLSAAADDPERLKDAAAVWETVGTPPPSRVFGFGPGLSTCLFQKEHTAEWQKMVLAGMSKAPLGKYAEQARQECQIYRLKYMDQASAEKMLSENPADRSRLISMMARKYIAQKKYREAEKLYRELAEIYHAEQQKPEIRKEKWKLHNCETKEFLARLEALRAMASDKRGKDAVREAETLLKRYENDDTKSDILSSNIMNLAYRSNLYDVALKYAGVYRDCALKMYDSRKEKLGPARYAKNRKLVETRALTVIYKSCAKLERQEEMFRALDELSRYLEKGDPTADYEKARFLIQKNRPDEARQYLENLNALCRQYPQNGYLRSKRDIVKNNLDRKP